MFKRKKANKSNYYFDSFPVLAHFSVECGEMILDYLKDFHIDNLEEMKNSVHLVEHEADTVKHEVTAKLLTEFMTPIDREDIFELLLQLKRFTFLKLIRVDINTFLSSISDNFKNISQTYDE